MSPAEKDAMSNAGAREVKDAGDALRSAAIRYSGSKRSGFKALEMAAFEALSQAADRYCDAIERRGQELGL